MKIKNGKLFIKENCISPISCNDRDYYKFIKKYSEQGYYQVILSSMIMIDLLQHYFIDRKFEINSITFMEEDNEIEEEIEILLEKIKENRERFYYLVEKLKFLNEDSSIDVKRIELSHFDKSGSTNLYLQANGLYGINENKYEEEEKYIKDIVEKDLL